MTTSYSERFQDSASVEDYESKEYGAGSYSAHIWNLQRPVVEKIIAELRQNQPRPLQLLDFACGTGRVISVLENLVDAAEGIDISDNMVSVARTKCRKARLQVGDILLQPELLRQRFNLITAFRFLLNVEPELRGKVLRRLREVISVPDGRLIVNVHGNSRSLRHPAIWWRRWREGTVKSGAMLNEMSPAETRQLLRASGFEIVRQFGFGMLPPTLYRTPLRRLAASTDTRLAGDRPWNNCAIDMLFVCRAI
jgi:ubiquinone/menaquinone biosynthesis C-methylase UbiE